MTTIIEHDGDYVTQNVISDVFCPGCHRAIGAYFRLDEHFDWQLEHLRSCGQGEFADKLESHVRAGQP